MECGPKNLETCVTSFIKFFFNVGPLSCDLFDLLHRIYIIFWQQVVVIIFLTFLVPEFLARSTFSMHHKLGLLVIAWCSSKSKPSSRNVENLAKPENWFGRAEIRTEDIMVAMSQFKLFARYHFGNIVRQSAVADWVRKKSPRCCVICHVIGY